MTNHIPPQEAKHIATKYQCDQVVILARRNDESTLSFSTPFGSNEEHAAMALAIAKAFVLLESGQASLIAIPYPKDIKFNSWLN